MSVYLNAIVMLAATLAGFIALAKLTQAVKSRRLGTLGWRGRSCQTADSVSRLAIEQTCMVDTKRRLLLIRCDQERVLLLTGGPADLVVSRCHAPRGQDLAV